MRILETRALINEKELEEQRADLITEMDNILNKVKEEKRSLTTEEETKFNKIKEQVEAIDKTLKAEEERGLLEKKAPANKKVSIEEMEERAFIAYVRGQVLEGRSGEQNVTMGNNGAVIPVSIANKIIKKVSDICPILEKATRYNAKGTLKVPVWGKANSTHDITVGYQAEFTELTADSGAFTSVDLGGYLAGALTLVGKSVINNADVDIVSFIVNEMAEKIAIFLEGQLLNGTGSSAAQGIVNGTNVVTAAAAAAISADDLIGLQAKVKQAFQGGACWIMAPDTFAAVKKLKDGNNRYLLQDNFQSDFPYMLLGKPVYLSDNMPALAASAKSVVYGDLSGLSVNFRENIEIQLLQEKYATQHAVGVCAWFEFDAKITDNQRFAVLVQKSA